MERLQWTMNVAEILSWSKEEMKIDSELAKTAFTMAEKVW